MDDFNLKRPPLSPPATGKLLIAEPFLKDGNFLRTVILLCDHSEEGTIGFVLNQETDLVLGEIVAEIATCNQPINIGGPVQNDTLHMLHQMPEILGGKKITDNIFWGGDFDLLKESFLTTPLPSRQLRLFLGYAGWAKGQLAEEMKDGAWIVTDANTDLVFNTAPQDVWRKAIALLGKEYRYLSQLPIDPQLN
jgi:putative transcriptional regulator